MTFAAIAKQLRGAVLALTAAAGVAGVAGAGEIYGIPVTEGDVPGYVPDATCGTCHGEIAARFPTIGMGRSFYRPSAETAIEDFEAPPFYHAPSDRHYRIDLRDGDYWFSRWRVGPEGARLDLFERRIDWVVGSGNRSRVYLYRVENGTMFQLPLAWYSQEAKWAMAPGFEFADHPGVSRLVRHRCMTCHNAYPEVPDGAGDFGMPEVFPAELPEGIGCQRCHGPGAAHVEAAFDEGIYGSDLDAVRAAIVNPAKLPEDRARDVCYSCHLQPSVPLPATLRPGRGVYDFRPGEALDAHIVQVDIVDATRAPDARFEINHHPYRMEQSPCFIESGGAFGCTSCHDPHGKAPVEERQATYRAVCAGCHETAEVHPDLAADADCTGCHMPARRPQDVPELWVTDHRIQLPPETDPLAPLDKRPAEVTEAFLYHPPADLRPGEAVIAQTFSILNYTNKTADHAAAALGRVLSAEDPAEFEPWLVFAESALRLGEFETAYAAAEQAALLAPHHPVPVKMMGLAKLQLGDLDAARALTERSLGMAGDMAEQHLNLGLMLARAGDTEAALASARRALSLNDTIPQAWRLIARLAEARGDRAAAAEAYEAALRIDPGAMADREALVALLQALGRSGDALLHRALLLRDMRTKAE